MRLRRHITGLLWTGFLVAMACDAAREREPGPDTPPPATTTRAESATTFVSVGDLRARIRSSSPPSIVDFRPREDFDAFHIPGSVHVPEPMISRAAATRAGQVVLVGPGHGAGRIVAVMAELHAADRGVSVLDGGMAAWCRAGAPTSGPCLGADIMTPAQLSEAVGCSTRAVLVAGAVGDPDIETLLPGARPFVDTPPQHLAEAAHRLVRATGARHLVVLDADGTTYSTLRATFAEIPAHVFFVAGGYRAYRDFVAVQTAAMAHHTVVSRTGTERAGTQGADAQGLRAPRGCGCL